MRPGLVSLVQSNSREAGEALGTHPLIQTNGFTESPGAGRALFDLCVEVREAMVHGGPYPAFTNFGATSVGTLAIRRLLPPVSYQNLPDALLTPELRQGRQRHCSFGVYCVGRFPSRADKESHWLIFR